MVSMKRPSGRVKIQQRNSGCGALSLDDAGQLVAAQVCVLHTLSSFPDRNSRMEKRMIEIKGKYNEAKIFTDVVDSASVAQVQELCNQEFTAGSRIRLMPDIHAGAGCTVGTTMTISDRMVPNLVGVDIGCGMETVRIRESHLELQKLDKLIYEKIPSGFSIRTKAHRYLDQIELSELCCARHVDLLRAEKSIGTLGGGNHFIVDNIGPTVDILKVIRPIYNFKAGEED